MARETVIQAYFNRRMAALLGLGFASGLPGAWAILGTPLQSWLLGLGIGLKTVGLFTLVGLPFAFNFVWAPLLDRYPPPLFGRLGRRRGWLLLVQLLLIGAIAGMAAVGPGTVSDPLWPLTAVGLFLAFLAATQDVLADAYRTDVLPDGELGSGAAVYVNGYRLAMVVAGGGSLLVAPYVGWPVTYLLLACLMSIGVAATLAAPRPPVHAQPPQTLAAAFVQPITDFAARYGRYALILLAFIIVFKLPDAMARVMTVPLLQEGLGYKLSEIAWIREWMGLAFTLAGALAGGAIVARIGLLPSLWVFGVLQMASNLGFTVLATQHRSVPLLFGVVAIESFCGGMVTAGFIAFLMSLCNRRFSATQYALFTSLNYFTGTVAGAGTGAMVKAMGYPVFFAMTVATGLPALVLLAIVHRRWRSLSRAAGDAAGAGST